MRALDACQWASFNIAIAPPDLYYSVGEMAKPNSLGHFEQLVLTAILTLREDA